MSPRSIRQTWPPPPGQAEVPRPQSTREPVPVAVGEDRQGRFVLLVEDKGDGTAVVHRHPVSVGELTSEGLEIIDGLSDGDVIATAGVRRLEDGRVVAYGNAS